MGRKAGLIRVNPKKFAPAGKPCLKEMVTFLNCLALNHNSDEKCVQTRNAMYACVEAQKTQAKKNPYKTLNYHLQRLSKGIK
ncbi:hypothetical protein QJS10_CPB19g00129 [Acorus calamus]|uniref:IMS import disulfide relay-system CHCH-CHCH-like Cx9C domain-containing protein n=1 Tax=Acorus calamus TaxID=4465 RepID=A0AAV9CFS7_ACOCL|nr:hypothetical protein QJS10_CPB19g00150 [Acorus calamus]KAK1288132.1 hypothetical protein QJS10_CPB19g00129 [Acorus calamus]